MTDKKKTPKAKQPKKRTSKYEQKLTLKGGFTGAIKEIVKDK